MLFIAARSFLINTSEFPESKYLWTIKTWTAGVWPPRFHKDVFSTVLISEGRAEHDNQLPLQTKLKVEQLTLAAKGVVCQISLETDRLHVDCFFVRAALCKRSFADTRCTHTKQPRWQQHKVPGAFPCSSSPHPPHRCLAVLTQVMVIMDVIHSIGRSNSERKTSGFYNPGSQVHSFYPLWLFSR